MVSDPIMRRKIRDQLALYREKKSSFGLADAQIDRMKIASALWWEDYGSDGPELQRFAVRILSQAVSTSCLEQLWSVYSHIASKKRNRLGVQRANDLVYVSANLRMLCKRESKKPDLFTAWEMAQEDPEAADQLVEEMEEELQPELGPEQETEPELTVGDYFEDVEIQLAPSSTSGA